MKYTTKNAGKHFGVPFSKTGCYFTFVINLNHFLLNKIVCYPPVAREQLKRFMPFCEVAVIGEIILKNLGKATKGKTTIIISHRTSSVKNADHIIVLDHGKVVQSGVHEDLIMKEGYYQDIYNQQLEEKLSGQES